MSGPWEKYRTAAPQAVADGPWTKYRSTPAAVAEAAPAAPDPRSEGMEQSPVGAAIAGAAQGVSFGLADEAKAAVRAIPALFTDDTFGDAYNRNLDHERAVLDRMREENPVAAYGGEIAGSLAIPGASYKAGASTGLNALRMGGTGAALGGAYGFGTGEGGFGERMGNTVVPSIAGGAVGAVAPMAIRGAQSIAQGRATGRALDQAAAAAPSIDDLRAQSSALYTAAANRGVQVKGGSFTPLVDDVTTMARDMGADPDLTPKAWAALRRLGEAGQGGDIGWRDLETLRRITSIASTAKEPADRRIAGAITERVDDFVMNLMDGDLSAGSAKGLGEELTEARKLWKQMRTSERLSGAMEAAKDAASGYENGLRIEFRKLLKDQKFFRSLSDGEKEAVRAVVRGTTMGNILKRVSRLSFGHGAQTNVLGASVGVGLGASAGGAIGGPAGAVVGGALTAGAGQAAGRGAERATESLARRAVGVAAAGGGQTLPEIAYQGNALRRYLPAAVGANALWNQ